MRVFRCSLKISYSKNLNQSCAFKLRTGLNYIYTIGMSIDLVLRAEQRAKLLDPEAPEGSPMTKERLESFINTYADSEAAMNFLVGDAAHDFGNYIATALANYGGITLADLAKHLQAVRRGEVGMLSVRLSPEYQIRDISGRSPLPPVLYNKAQLEREFDVYSTSKGESIYLEFLKQVRGDSRLTLLGTFNLRDPAEMAELLGKCNHYVIDATYGNPFKYATNTKHVYDLITGKTDAGSGLGANAVGHANYHNDTVDFTIPNYFYGIPLKFGALGGLPYMEMDLRSINPLLGIRTVRLPKGASVNALCEALGLPGIRNDGNAGSKVRLTVLYGAPYPHPFDFLFKTGTDLGTLLQSIDLETTIGPTVGTLTNDRFFKERAAEFERQIILFTPDARSHTAQLFSSIQMPPLSVDEQRTIRDKLTAYAPDPADPAGPADPAEFSVIARLMTEIDKPANQSCITDYIRAELVSIYYQYQDEKRSYLVALPEPAPGAADFYKTYRNLLPVSVYSVLVLLKLFIMDKLVKLQDEILQFKTTIASAFGRFKSANSDETNKRKTIFKIIKNAVERIYVAPAGGGGGAPPPSKEVWVARTLAALSSNFVGTYGTIGTGQGVLTSITTPTATEYVCGILGETELEYCGLFPHPRMNIPQDTTYIKTINTVTKIIDAPVTAAAGGARRAKRASRSKAKRGSRRVQRGGEFTEDYPLCLLETGAADPRNFYPALIDPANFIEKDNGIKAPINDLNLLFSLVGTFNVLIFTHAMLYALIEDFHGNNTGVLVESSLMDLGVLISAKATITNEQLVTHIRFLLYDYDAIIPTLISRLSTAQLGYLAHREFITEGRIAAALADPMTDRYFSLIGQGAPFREYELEPWKLLLLGVVPGGLVLDKIAADAFAGAVAAIYADIRDRLAEDTAADPLPRSGGGSEGGGAPPPPPPASAPAASQFLPTTSPCRGAGGGGGSEGGGAPSPQPPPPAASQKYLINEEAAYLPPSNLWPATQPSNLRPATQPSNLWPATPLLPGADGGGGEGGAPPPPPQITFLVPTEKYFVSPRPAKPLRSGGGGGGGGGGPLIINLTGLVAPHKAGKKRMSRVLRHGYVMPNISEPQPKRLRPAVAGARKTRRKRNKNKGRKTRRS